MGDPAETRAQSVSKTVFRVMAVTAAVLATIQPVLGPMAMFARGGAADEESLHLVGGGILYNLALLLALMAGFIKFRRRWILLGLCIVQYVLLHVQLRLGLGTNEEARLLVYHIPLGVVILVVSYLTVALTFGVRLDAREA